MIKFEIYANDTVVALQDLRTLGRLAETYLQGGANPPAEPYVGETPFPSTPVSTGSPETPKAPQSGKGSGGTSKTSSGTKTVTPEEARARGQAAAKKHGKEVVKAILAKFGAPSISSLKAEDRAPFLAALDELDAEKGGGTDT